MFYVFEIRKPGEDEIKVQDVDAPDYAKAVMALAAWCPGIHVIKLLGIHAGPPGNA